MKLLTFKRVGDKSDVGEFFDDMAGTTGLFVQLETKEEDSYYNDYAYTDDVNKQTYYDGIWTGYMLAKLGDIYSDEEIYHYFFSTEEPPKLHEIFTLDDMIWERVA